LSEPKGTMTHPDPDVLAEFRAGLITGRRGARVSAHLAACERCAGLCDELAEVSALLAAVPVPVMPETVVMRLETALAAEAAKKDDAERAAGDGARDRATSPRPRKHWDFRLVALRVLAPAGALVVLAAGGYGLSRIVASSAGPGSAATAAALPVASAAPGSGSTSRHEAVQEAPFTFAVVTSTTDYQRATLRQQLALEMQRYAQRDAGSQGLASESVKACVSRVTTQTPLLVEMARFEGRPANVIVVMSGHREAVWVTTPTCSASSHYVLDTTTLAGTSTP
jgi:hypothetical protein